MILALGTERTTLRFLQVACGGGQSLERYVVPSREPPWRHVQAVRRWLEQNPGGRIVSFGDPPSLVHALSGAPGANLRATLASFDKIHSRTHLSPGSLRYAPLRRGAAVAPSIGVDELLLKPRFGTASQGLVRLRSGDRAPEIPPPPSWLEELYAREVPHWDSDAGALVEEYVPPEVPRVSVDGWVDNDGHAHLFGVSDNVYVDGEPERFRAQVFPSLVSPQGHLVRLYREVAARLADQYGLRSQFLDVEMFAFPDRAEVMEVNCRVHPNISPVLDHCLEEANVFQWHQQPSRKAPRARPETAASLTYLWSDANRPWLCPAVDDDTSTVTCPFDCDGPRVGDQICRGWLYSFGEEREAVLAEGQRNADTFIARGYDRAEATARETHPHRPTRDLG